MARLGRAVGLVEPPNAPRLGWTEVQGDDRAIHGRSIALDLSTLGRGTYTLKLAVSVKGQQPVEVSREFEVR